jgi:acetylornithine deacetylase/succinyl-diaminopimelate desuccinylase-like protein
MIHERKYLSAVLSTVFLVFTFCFFPCYPQAGEKSGISVAGGKSGEGNSNNGNLMQRVNDYRKANELKIIREYFQLLSIPNVSSDRANIRRNAQFLKERMEVRGLRVELWETPGNPAVFGELNVKNARSTLLFYVHYDGQPVDSSRWVDSQPFEPVFRPGKLEPGAVTPKPVPISSIKSPIPGDWRVYARSTSDDKAPVIALLTAIDAVRASGETLKNNIKFILDGEEEAGSPNLPYILKKYSHRLKADVLFMCDGPGYYSGDPTLIYGVRGITSISITVYGPDTHLHSGHYGNWAPNPAMRLAQLLTTMKDSSGNILIKGFNDTTVPLSAREIKALADIPRFDDSLKTLYGFSGTESGERHLMEAILYPSLNVNGLSSGWVGKDARTIVPSTATASIDIRLAKGNTPSDMIQKVIRHIRARGYHVVEADPDRATRKKYPLIARVVQEEEGYRASRTSMDHPVSLRVIEALGGEGSRSTVLIPSLGGSLPIYIFEDILKIPFIGIPIANHDNNQHQPNENIRIDHFWNAIETFAAIIQMK